jgi:hypothetical protein
MRMVRALHFPFSGVDLALAVIGFSLTFWVLVLSLETGAALGLGLLFGLCFFLATVMAFMLAPHIAIAVTIPFFAFLPAIKVLAVPWIGGSKDVIVFAAVLATCLVTLQRIVLRRAQPIDRWVLLLVGFLLTLYVLNVGGGLHPSNFGIAWFHGVRLVAEPLFLLLVGMSVDEPRRVLRWAVGSLLVTASFVASIGLLQQLVGGEFLVNLGYEWDTNVRTISGRLRSFGTLEEPFAYAAFLLSALATMFFVPPRTTLLVPAAAVIAAGIAVSYVRTAAVVALALIGLWLVRRRQGVAAAIVIATALVAAIAFLVSASATETRTVRGDASTYLTINGRTDAWSVALGGPLDWVFGRGVGVVGTAAERATLSVSGTRKEAEEKSGTAVDSGYFAAVADVGLAGLAVLLALLGRLLALGASAARRGERSGWLAIALLSVVLLDATTRASFTGFPTAFLGMLLLGVAIAAGRAPDRPRGRTARAGRPLPAL